MSFIGNIMLSTIAFIVIPILILISIRKSTTSRMLDISFSDSLKGIFAIYISLHHYSQYINVNMINEILTRIGYLCVSFFFLMSGYGLTIGYLKKGISEFFKKRIMRIYFPFVIANILTGLLYMIFMKENITLLSTITTSLVLHTVYANTILWYVLTQIIMYILFYVSFCNKKDNNFKCVMLTIFTIVCIAFCFIKGIDEWRYNTVLCFTIGVVFAIHKEKVETFIKTNLIKIISICSFSFIICFYFVYTYKLYIFMSIVSSLLFVIIITSISKSICIKSKIFALVGNASYEYYILQYPIIYMVMKNIKNDILHPIIIVVCSIALAIVTNKITKILIKKIIK